MNIAPFAADLTIKAAASLGIIKGGEIDTAGRLRAANGGLSFLATRCAVLRSSGSTSAPVTLGVVRPTLPQ